MKPLESTPNSNESKTGGIGPGDRLQAARIEMGLSVEDIANRMHLSVAILESIEENNFEHIAAPIFVKGYLRAYARMTSLEEEEIIRQYMDFYSDGDPPINSTSNTWTEISSDDARIKWTTYTVIIILAGLLAVWWWNKDQGQNDALSLAVEQSEAVKLAEPASDSPSIEPEIVASSEVAGEEIEASTAEIEASNEAGGAPTEDVGESAEEIEASTVADEIEQKIEVETPEPEASAATQAESVVEPVAAVSEEPTGEVSQPTIAGSDELKVIVNADTWADIKDADGNRLTYNLLRADRKLTLTGLAPFSVFFGNGHGVELIFNGEEVDIASRIKDDNTARLKIGSN